MTLIYYFILFTHQCNWTDCEHVGKAEFKATWNASRCNPDALQAEKIHFYFPALTYEKVEGIVLGY